MDKLTNEIEAMPIDKIYIRRKGGQYRPRHAGHRHTEERRHHTEQSVELPNGAKFTADLQYNVSKRDVVFRQLRSIPSQSQDSNRTNSPTGQGPWHNADGSIKRR